MIKNESVVKFRIPAFKMHLLPYSLDTYYSMVTMAIESSSNEGTSLLENGGSNGVSYGGGNGENGSNQSLESLQQNDAPSPTSKETTESEVIETTITSYIRLLLFFIASIIAGGIIPGQNEYNRLFCEAGIFRYSCKDNQEDIQQEFTNNTGECCQAQWLLIANLMNTFTIFVMFLFIVSGLLFDMIGGRYSALLGCAMLCIGISLLSGLVYLLSYSSNNISPSVETLVFIMGIILCDCGSLLVNFGFYGFLWHLPKRQALVVSLSNSCFACASFIPLVISAFMSWSGYNLSVSLVIYAVIILFSGVVCGITIPSIEEYRSQALKVLGLPIPRRTVRGWKGAKKQLSEAFLVLLDPEHVNFHKITICAAVLAFLPPFIWMSMADPLGDEIFSSSLNESSSTLGVLFLKINSIVGLLVGPAVAVLVDKCQHPSEGLTEIMILLSVSFAVVAPLCGVADWTVQTIVLVFVAAGQTLCLLYITRYAVVFSYPNRVGTVSGVLVAALSVLTLPLVLIMSIGIVFVGYVWPAAISSAIGCVACALYVVYLKREQPFPKRPTLLAKDELDIAKNFAVATIEDAAYVADMTKDELLALSASTKVESMRRLSNASMSDEAGMRMLKVARRRSSLCSVESTFSALDYPIPPFAEDKVVKGKMETSADCIYQAFNGHGNYPGGRSEPSIEWMMNCIGPPDHPSRIDAVTSVFKPMLAASENFGIILEVKDHDPLTGELVTAASCACYPPGELEDSGGPMKVGSKRYYWAYSRANVSLSFGDKPQEFIQKMAAFKQDSQWDDKRKDFGIDKMWYVAVLGTHAAYQKRGYGRLLLSIVSSYADETQHDCYLECSEGNVPFYQSNGYEIQWNQTISVEGSSTSIYGMAKKYQR